MIHAAASPPIRSFSVAIFAVSSHHLHKLRVIIAANFKFGFHPMERVCCIVIPVVSIHVDSGHGRINSRPYH